MTYIALLRGINVGGNRKVEMAKLKQTFERLGFENVKTFVASGNVIFRTGLSDKISLTKTIEIAIEKEFGFPVAVLIKKLPEIERLVKNIPNTWVNDKAMKCDVIFLWPEIDNQEILKQIPHNSEIEDVIYLPGAVVWRIERDKIRQGQALKISGPNTHKQLTARNVNTVRKFYDLLLSASKT